MISDYASFLNFEKKTISFSLQNVFAKNLEVEFPLNQDITKHPSPLEHIGSPA
jgi:hypothetical protein